jgi:Arc/MetJ-type ribon-helix-helix transcriptional regulator
MLHKAYKNTGIECIRAYMRTKLSVTIDSELIKWVEKQIEKKVFRSKSHALEYALSQLIKEWEERK